MNIIGKYPLESAGVTRLETAKVIKFLKAGLDGDGQPCLWAVVDLDAPKESHQVAVLPTGKPITVEFTDELCNHYLSTFTSNAGLVWHVFVK